MPIMTPAEKAKYDGYEADINSNNGQTLDNALALQTLGSLDIGIGVNYLDFKPQTVEPPYKHGRMYYDDEEDVFEAYSDFPVPYYIGRSTHITVFNGTGALIPKGTPVKMVGASGSYISIGIAQSDLYENSRVIGITQMDIADQTQGLAISNGLLEMDTSALTPGTVQYLGFFGGYNSTPTDIPVLLGEAIDSQAEGHFLVSIDNFASKETSTGALQFIDPNTPKTVSLTGTYQKFTGYNANVSKNIAVDEATGAMVILNTGQYKVNLTASMEWSQSSSTRNVTFEVKINGTTYTDAPVDLAKGSDKDTRTISMILNLNENDSIEVGALTDTGNYDVDFKILTFELTSAGLN